MSNKINNVFNMMRRALNTLDYQLMDHGERVAYLLLNMYEADGDCTDEQLVKICHLGIFHDIGAYQTEMLDSLVSSSSAFNFEVANTLSHSVYGYMFLKRLEFFDEYADAVLFHHFSYDKLSASDCMNKKLAARMFIADRLDIMILKGYAKTIDDVFNFLKNPVFCKEEAEHLINVERSNSAISEMLNGRYLEKVLSFLNGTNLHEDHVRSLLLMLPGAIDFRSEHTVTHTAATVEISLALAELFKLSEDEVESIRLGSMLHDIGKISVSPMILEKTSALSANEFKIMKDHVLLSEHILRDCVSDEVLQIAIRHHEKLDGTGYPKGLKDEELSLAERIVAVADILSALMGRRSYKEPFPKEKVVGIIEDMAGSSKICREVADVAVSNYEFLSEITDRVSDASDRGYREFQSEAKKLYNKYS